MFHECLLEQAEIHGLGTCIETYYRGMRLKSIKSFLFSDKCWYLERFSQVTGVFFEVPTTGMKNVDPNPIENIACVFPCHVLC